MRHLLSTLALALMLHSACAGTEPVDTTVSETDTDTDSDTDSDADTDADADTDTDSDTHTDACDGCSDCQALPEGGTLYCVTAYTPPIESCARGLTLGECCEDADCNGGTCVAFSHQYCGGAPPPEENVCRQPECTDDASCGSGKACIPHGAFGAVVPTCIAADCVTDSDCTAGAEGQCLPLSTGPCGAVGGFYCTYGDDPCRADADCPSISHPELCLPASGGGTECVEQLAFP